MITTYCFLYKLIIGEFVDVSFNFANIYFNFFTISSDLRNPYTIFCYINYLLLSIFVIIFCFLSGVKRWDDHWWPLREIGQRRKFVLLLPTIFFIGGILFDIPFFIFNGIVLKRTAFSSSPTTTSWWASNQLLSWAAFIWSAMMLIVVLKDLFMFLTDAIWVLPLTGPNPELQLRKRTVMIFGSGLTILLVFCAASTAVFTIP